VAESEAAEPSPVVVLLYADFPGLAERSEGDAAATAEGRSRLTGEYAADGASATVRLTR
jgi:hypothetical protein